MHHSAAEEEEDGVDNLAEMSRVRRGFVRVFGPVATRELFYIFPLCWPVVGATAFYALRAVSKGFKRLAPLID